MTMASLREPIAEILEGLAYQCAQTTTLLHDAHVQRLWDGAQTLRWADDPERDPDAVTVEQYEDLSNQLDSYENTIDEIRGLWTAQLVKATALTPAKFRDAIGEAIADL